jgi:dynein heavy chain
LFKERIRKIDKHIWQGKHQHTWIQPEINDWLSITNNMIEVTFEALKNYKSINCSVQNLCQEIESLEMIKISSEEIINGERFQTQQSSHILAIHKTMKEQYDRIKKTVSQLKDDFTSSGTKVAEQWTKYEDKIDERVAMSIRKGIVNSLTVLAETISNSGKTGIIPVLKINVSLKEGKVCINPKLASILEMFQCTQSNLINIAKRVGQGNEKWLKTISNLIEQDEEFQEIQQNIQNHVKTAINEVEEYIKTWDIYKDTWELSPEKLVSKYMDTHPDTSAFDADIAKHRYLSKNCKKHDAQVWIGFMLVDCYPLQEGVVKQCDHWQEIFMELMKEMLQKNLNLLYHFMVIPDNVFDLRQSLKKHSTIMKEIPFNESKFPEIFQISDIMLKYKRDLPSEDSKKLAGMKENWQNFKDIIQDHGARLQSIKEKFKEEFLSKSQEYERHVKNTLEEYTLSGPFGTSWKTDEAFKQLNMLKQKVNGLFKIDKEISEGLEVFSIQRDLNKDMAELMSKIELLSLIWHMAEEWEEVHEKWQQTKIICARVSEIEANINVMTDRLNLFNDRDIDNRWEIFSQVKYQIQSYDRTKHLIELLVDNALRKRHWESILVFVKDANPNFNNIFVERDDIKIEDLTGMGFDKCLANIEEVIMSAQKEIAIENDLDSLAQKVRTTQIETDVNKQDFYYIKNLSSLFDIYHESHIKLRELKLSKYINPFGRIVEELEKDISIILSLIEKLECAEKNLVDVKEIFSVYCVKKQLPKEYRLLSDALEFWSDVMSNIQSDARIYKFSAQKLLTQGITDMIMSLEKIKEYLYPFLECRREQCYRLYVLTNEQLLKLLGSKTCHDLSAVIQQIFPNISQILGSNRKDGSIMIQKILTFDGETIVYQSDPKGRESIENIVLKIDEILVQHVKSQIINCLQSLKKGTKLEQVQKDYSWQAYDVARKIMFTSEIQKVFETTSGTEQNSKLVELIKKSEEHMERIGRSIQLASNAKIKLKLINNNNTEFGIRLALVLMQQYQFRHSIDNCISMPQWFSTFKYYYLKSRNEILVSHGYQNQIYGCESLKMDEPIVLYPQANETLLQISTAYASSKCPFFSGQSGSGKSQKLKFYSYSIGKLFYTCQINENFPRRSLRLLFNMVKRQAFFINIVMKQIDNKLVLHLAEEINLINTSLPAISKNMNLIISTDQLDRNLIRTVYQKRKIYRIIFDFEEITNKVLDSKFAVESFQNFELLRARMSIMIRCFNAMFMSSNSHLTVVQIFKVIDSAIELRKKDKNMLQEESILQAFWMFFDNISRYELSFPVHTAIKDLYPRLEIKMIKETLEDNIELFVHEFTVKHNLYYTENLVRIVKECWVKLRTGKCIVLSGKSNTLKTTICQILLSLLADIMQQSVVTLNVSLSEEYIMHLVGKQFKNGSWQDGVLTKLVNEHFDIKLVIWFDGSINNSNVAQLNKLMKIDVPIVIPNNRQTVLPKKSQIIVETPEISKNLRSKLQHCCIVEIKECSIDSFNLLESYFNHPSDSLLLKESINQISKFLDILSSECKPMIETDHVTSERNFLNIFKGLIQKLFEDDLHWKENMQFVKKAIFFSALWAIFATIDNQDQVKVDNIIRKNGTDIPVYGTVFDYYIDSEMFTWENWNKNVSEWNYNSEEPHSSFYIRTITFIKFDYILNLLASQGTHVLLLGPIGCGKTSIVKEFVKNSVQKKNHVISIQVCSNTKASHIFNSIYQFTEKKTKQEVQPINGKKIMLVLDDVNLKENNILSEPLRFFAEKGRWIINGEEKKFTDLIIIGTEHLDVRCKPGSISWARKPFQSFYVDKCSTDDILKMYTTVLKGKFLDFEVNIKFLTQSIIKATMAVYNSISSMFQNDKSITTTFFVSDIKKVICGVLRSHKDCHDTKFEVVQLWVHEVLRTFRDRMMSIEDENKVVEIVREQTKTFFNLNFDSLCENEQHWEPPLFGNILDTYGFYTDLDSSELSQYLQHQVEEYNSIEENPKLTIVFNQFFIKNIVRILRVVSEPEGHIVMSGESGNCRQSVARLAAYIYKMEIFMLSEIDILENEIWIKTLRSIIRTAGIENKKTLLFTALGSQNCENFLQMMSNILIHGLDPMLFEQEEIIAIERKKTDFEKIAYIDISQNVIKNIHVVFSMDLNDPLTTEYFSKFKCLISKFVINHIKPYSVEDLEEMAMIYLEQNAEQEIKKELPILTCLFAKIYTYSKQFNLYHNGTDIIKPTSFYLFLEEFTLLLKLKLEERKQMQEKLAQIFKNYENAKKVIDDLYLKSAESKSRLSITQKAYDELLILQMQLKRDHEDIQRKLIDEQKKAADEKASFSQIEYSLKSEMEDLWYPVEKCKLQLKELTAEDEDLILEDINKGRLKSPFLNAAAILFSSDQELTEQTYQQVMNGMINITSDRFNESRLLNFVEFLAKNKPKQEFVNMVEKTYIHESIKQWCLAVEAFGKGKKSSNQKKQKCDQLRKRYESRQDVMIQVKGQVIALESDLESLEENLAKEIKNMEKDSKEIEKIEQKIEKAEKVRRILGQDLPSYQAAFERYISDKQKIIGHSILGSAVLGYFSSLSSEQRKELIMKWKEFLNQEKIIFDDSFDHKIFLVGPNIINTYKKLQSAQTEHMLENYLILQSKNINNIIICIDPEDQATSVLSVSEESTGTLVSHINDQYLKKNLIQSLARGETLIVRNAEQNYEYLYLPFVRKFFKKENETIYITFSGSLCHYNANFKLRILIPSFKHIQLTSKMLVMNFKYEITDLQMFFFNIISTKKLSPISQQKRDMLSIISEASAAKERSEIEILNCLSLPLDTLLEDKPLQEVNKNRENVQQITEKNELYDQYLKTAEKNLEVSMPLSCFCALVYTEMTRLEMINSVYSISLAKFVEMLNLKDEDSDDTEESEMTKKFGLLKLNPDENRILTCLFSKLEFTMKMDHFLVISFILGLAISKEKGVVDNLEMQNFLTQIHKISDCQSENFVNMMAPCLSESEAKVICAVMETTKREDIFRITEDICELTFLKRLSIISVFSIEALLSSIKKTLTKLLNVQLSGKCTFINIQCVDIIL